MIASKVTLTLWGRAGWELRTFLYLDLHILLNRIKTVTRNPLRLILWLLFAALLVSVLQGRAMMNAAIRAHPFPRGGREPVPFFIDPTPFLHTVAAFVPGIVLAAVGLFILTASRQPLATFRSAADARFLCGSWLSQRLVVLWLVLRVILSASWRIPMMAALFFLVLPTVGLSTGTALISFVALCLVAANLTLSVPIFIARRRRIGPNPTIAGWLLLLVGLASLVVVFVALSPGPSILPASLQPIAASLPPGGWLVAAFEGNAIALLPLAALAAASVLLTWLLSADVYPELWQASARMIVLRRALRSRGPFITRSERRAMFKEAGLSEETMSRRQTAPSSRGHWVPPGAWTILWKEWLSSRRVAGGLRVPAITLLVAVTTGAAVGILSRSGDAASLVIVPLGYLVIFGSFFTAMRMGADLRKPIWWLSTSSLGARLAVLTAARSLRMVVPISAGLLTATLLGGHRSFVVVGVPIIAALVWALNAMGVLMYAIIPSSADMRGPGGLLRGCLLGAMLVPMGIAALIGAIVAGGSGALLMMVGTTLAEGWILIVIATSQLDGNGLAYAQAERR